MCLNYVQNIELFFCLYAHSWDEPQQCNSNHSRLLGFFACLPPMYVYPMASLSAVRANTCSQPSLHLKTHNV